jgi:ATP-dependent protease HslVU (ClpYQ) peptidase subunit
VGLEHVSTIVEFVKKNGVCLVGIHGQVGIGKKTLFNEVVVKVERVEKHVFTPIEVGEDLC